MEAINPTMPEVPKDETLDELMKELTVEVARANRRTNGDVNLHINRGKWIDIKRWAQEPGRWLGVFPADGGREARIDRENLMAAIEAVKNI